MLNTALKNRGDPGPHVWARSLKAEKTPPPLTADAESRQKSKDQ
jgi:hypothetical protein